MYFQKFKSAQVSVKLIMFQNIVNIVETKVMELQLKITTMKASISIPNVENTEPMKVQVTQESAITDGQPSAASSEVVVVGNVAPQAVNTQVITTNVVQPPASNEIVINANVVPVQAQVGVISVVPAVTMQTITVAPAVTLAPAIAIDGITLQQF